jgi:hypothetical protein
MPYRVMFAMAASNLEYPRRFRSYPTRENRSINCKVWEVARSTTAAPTFFKRISIGLPVQIAEDFIDVGIKCNNPVEVVMDEARLVFKGDRPVGSIVSMGTGGGGAFGLAKPDLFQKILPLELINILKKIATDCEGVVNKMDRRFFHRPDVYFRFNVTHGRGSHIVGEIKSYRRGCGSYKGISAKCYSVQVLDSVVKILCSEGRNDAQGEQEFVH